MILLPIVLMLQLMRLVVCTSCPNTITTAAETKPLYLLTLVPFPDPQDGAGWDNGLSIISGARVARDEINNRTDLLPGYHIELIVENIEACSRTEAGIGLSNLVKYTVNPPCRPVVAVTGLVCSSHTLALSPVAGHDKLDLIQLSIANSPIFITQNDDYSHLWHFLGSATEYVDTALALMDRFGWTKIGLVYDTGSVFHFETARYFSRQIKESRNKTIAFDVAVRDTNHLYFQQILSHLRNSEETIMFVSLNAHQACLLLDQTLKEGFVYPDYTWILVETRVESLVLANVLEPARVYNASRGHIHVFVQAQPDNKSITLLSGDSIAMLETKYNIDFEKVSKEYSWYNITQYMTFASYMYDQVWALSLALNNSLPVLATRNLSIDNYSIKQHEITDVIEQQLANLSFQGAGGWIEFNEYRSTYTPVEIFWLLENGTEKRVGIYNPLDSTGFHVNIDASEIPNDTIPKRYFLISLPVAILLYVLTATLILFTTVQLILYLHYRDHKVIKATSPYLSLLMFAGSYVLCVAAAVKITYVTFAISKEDFIKIFSTSIVLVLNGFSLILITLFIKLLRVYRIFSTRLNKDLGKYWSNFPLLLTIIFLTVLPNIVVLPLIFLHPLEYDTKNIYRGTFTEVHIVIYSPNFLELVGLIAGYVVLFSLVILYLAIRTRKIKHRNFNDTKKLNFFIFVTFFTTALIPPLYVIILKEGNETAAEILLVLGMLVISAASQFILFLPKVLPTVLSSFYPEWTTLYSTVLLHIHPTYGS